MPLLLLLLLCLSSLPFLSLAAVPAIIVFGDSTVDTGNNNAIPTLLKSNFMPYGRDFLGKPYPTGRFSNGRLASDFYAEAFGLGPIVPAYLDPAYTIKDFASAVCFASAGTGLDNATSDVLSVIPLWKEVEYFKEYQERLKNYLGEEKAKWTVNEALYIISIGTNDFVENYYSYTTTRFKEFTVDEYKDFLIYLTGNFIQELYSLGARKIGFTGLCPIGCVPLERTMNFFQGGECLEERNKVARDFNSKFQELIGELSASLPGLRLVYLPVYDFFLQLVQNPSLYGYEDVEHGCCATGLFELGYLCNQWNPFTCIDADKFVFWDAVHPTEKTSRIVANYLVNTTLSQFM
ncbi:putative GDSL lipase/esterase, SGNH hydrolase superfamily [Dioscorea sansibarensis]